MIWLFDLFKVNLFKSEVKYAYQKAKNKKKVEY